MSIRPEAPAKHCTSSRLKGKGKKPLMIFCPNTRVHHDLARG